MPSFWILKDRVPVKADMVAHMEFFRVDANRRVAETLLPGARISTVFLGIDHNFERRGPPILFETMVFDDGGEEERQERYATWAEAEAGHDAIVAEECAFRGIPVPARGEPPAPEPPPAPAPTAWERLQRDDLDD